MAFRGLRPVKRTPLLAALLIVLHTLSTAWAMGQGPMLDAFGNPLCITSDQGDRQPAGDHGNIPNCCTFGCSHISDPPAPPPDATVEILRPAALLDRRRMASVDRSLRGLDHNPANPRAPPSSDLRAGAIRAI